jgi:hypothetical protein
VVLDGGERHRAVTFIAIYRQLSLARGASAREQLESSDREWDSERFARCKLEVLLARRGGADPASVPSAAAIAIASFCERIAALARGGHLDPKLLQADNGGAVPVWWVALAPFVHSRRAELRDATEFQQFEWLAGVMAGLDRRAGASVLDEALFAIQLNGRIASLQDRLRFEQALRSAIVAAPDPLAVGEPAARPTAAAMAADAEAATTA